MKIHNRVLEKTQSGAWVARAMMSGIPRIFPRSRVREVAGEWGGSVMLMDLLDGSAPSLLVEVLAGSEEAAAFNMGAATGELLRLFEAAGGNLL